MTDFNIHSSFYPEGTEHGHPHNDMRYVSVHITTPDGDYLGSMSGYVHKDVHAAVCLKLGVPEKGEPPQDVAVSAEIQF